MWTAALGVGVSIYCLLAVNTNLLTPLARLAVFAAFGLVLSFLTFPVAKRWGGLRVFRVLDVGLALLSVFCCGYILVEGKDLGQRAGIYNALDVAVGITGIVLVLEATRRSIGIALPIIALLFLAYAVFGPWLPDWAFPHGGFPVEDLATSAFLGTGGVFGTALSVMLTYVYLFVIFGALLEATGATQFIIDFAGRLFARSPGGPAKVAVLSSGLLGSLSGSAVANTVTSGTFTIPMMRSSGFDRHVAAGVEASASSGGALVPPVMGAGAYMMLEIIDPPVTYLEVIRAALVPAILYYLSIFLIVHFYAKRKGAAAMEARDAVREPIKKAEGLLFVGSLLLLLVLLISGFTPYRSVTVAMAGLFVLSLFHRRTRLTPARLLAACTKSARNGTALIAASACVGIVIGVVTQTGVGTAFVNAVLPLAEQSLFLALLAIMACSIVLGMGLPSAVCYLLMATLIGPVLNRLGVAPLAAHLFIFYFGLMSMVTPPVALAAYAAASIADAPIMKTGLAAFRFSIVGFALPFLFVYRPELLLLGQDGESVSVVAVAVAVALAALGILALAASITGQLRNRLGPPLRLGFFVTAAVLIFPGPTIIEGISFGVLDLVGVVTFFALAAVDGMRNR